MNHIFDEPISMNQIFNKPISMNCQLFDEHGSFNHLPLKNMVQ
jgi:hypothetical protein